MSKWLLPPFSLSHLFKEAALNKTEKQSAVTASFVSVTSVQRRCLEQTRKSVSGYCLPRPCHICSKTQLGINQEISQRLLPPLSLSHLFKDAACNKPENQ